MINDGRLVQVAHPCADVLALLLRLSRGNADTHFDKLLETKIFLFPP